MKTLKIGLIASIIIYSCGLLYTHFSNTSFNERVAKFDTNNNGLIDNKEITKDSKAIVRQQASRKTTDQAVIMLIPVSLILGLFVGGISYLFIKIKAINDNEIDYRKGQR